MTLPTGKMLSKNSTDQTYHFRTMPGHYGDKKKKAPKKVSKGLAALAKKRPKVAAAIMKNKKKK